MDSLSPAAALADQHDSHLPSVEDTVDEYDVQHPVVSTPKSASNPVLDVRSEELFPALGSGSGHGHGKSQSTAGTPWAGRKSGSNINVNGSSQSSTASTRAATPMSTDSTAAWTGSSQSVNSLAPPKVMSIPGKHVEQIRFAPSQMMPRGQLKKPIRDILRDTGKKYRATVDVRSGPNDLIIFEGKGSVDNVRQALKEVAQQVGSKQSVRVPIPRSARPHVIGRGGSVVQGIYERTGARIHVPKLDTSIGDDDDDSATIDVLIEGDAVAAEMARREIESVTKERSSNINIRLKNIPPEFFPFIAGPHDAHIQQLEERTKAQIRVPRYDTWSRPPPQEAPPGQIQFVTDADRQIVISGERVAAQQARAELERHAQELQRQITLRQLAINRGQHQFILGDYPDALHSFLAETGCSIVLPPQHDDTEFLTITGPADRIELGINRAMDLATSMQMASVDLSRQHPSAACGPHVHARALTTYLRQRQVIKELERLYDAHIVLPSSSSSDGPVTWEVYSRDGKNTIRARSDIVSLIQAHPPARVLTIPVDPYCHAHLSSKSAERVARDFGVRLVVPDEKEEEHVVLIYEGPEGLEKGYQLPRRRPSDEELVTFEKALRDARAYILEMIGDQNDVTTKTVSVPVKHHDRLRKFVTREQESKGPDSIPVRIRSIGPQINLRGRTADVDDLSSKINAFLIQQEKDDLERGYTISFDFPQKFANYLIGKRGENINKLRDEFDVDIKVENGKVEVKGPKAKADAAKTRIVALAKKLEDEATYVLKVPASFHRDLIGRGGDQVNRLQTRYNVRVQFPRQVAAPATDDLSINDTVSEVSAPRNTRPTQAADEIIVRGPRQGADSARDEILSLYQYLVDTSHTASVSVARTQVPSLIGQRGREMEKLRTETGAQIDVPSVSDVPADAQRVDIVIKGTKRQVEDAKRVLETRVREFDSSVVRVVHVDKVHHKGLIGGGGSNIRKIVAEAGGPSDSTAARMVRFPRSDSADTAIRLEGNSAIVDKVAAAIEEFVRAKEDQTIISLDIPQSQHRLLIGPGGETRRNLEKQFSVNLDVPRQGSGNTDVKIKGGKDAVEQARVHILSLIKQQHSETINVPVSLHHVIADNGAVFSRLRKDFNVSVDHAGHKIPPRPTRPDLRNGQGTELPLITDDPSASSETHSWKLIETSPTPESSSETIPWALTGPLDKVPLAASLISKALETASHESCTGYLILPDPNTYRFVIGPGGSTINDIRKVTGCRIQVPKHQARGEAVEIKGGKDGVERARVLVLDAVRRGGRS